jgi:hypothetical protein
MLNFDEICRYGRFDVREARLSPERGGKQAMIIPRQADSFEIRVDPTPRRGWARVSHEMRDEVHRQRRRFLICHELAHSFFFKRDGGRPQRLLPGSPYEERFCDEFARWLLVPQSVARELPAAATTIFALHIKYDVSIEVASRAVAHAHNGRYLVVVGVARTAHDAPPRLQWTSGDDADANEILESTVARDLASEPRGGVVTTACNIGGLVVSAAFHPQRRQLVAVCGPMLDD